MDVNLFYYMHLMAQKVGDLAFSNRIDIELFLFFDYNIGAAVRTL